MHVHNHIICFKDSNNFFKYYPNTGVLEWYGNEFYKSKLNMYNFLQYMTNVNQIDQFWLQ